MATTCSACARKGRRVELKHGKSLAAHIRVAADFYGDKEDEYARGRTMYTYVRGPAILIKCLKCPECGHSVSPDVLKRGRGAYRSRRKIRYVL